MEDIWDAIIDERRKLADDLDTLTGPQWHTPSAIDGWTNHHVTAHLVWPLTTPPRTLFTHLARNFFIIERTINWVAATEKRPGSELTALYRKASHRRFAPGGRPEFPLAEVLIHGQDIRYPLGIAYTGPSERVNRALDFLRSGYARLGFVPKRLSLKFRFESTDTGYAAGSGPTVRGPANALLLSMCGRKIALEKLDGDGAPAFVHRVRAL